jgi:phosphatidylglycerol:prolipoprotein diacylglycerol transferase
MYNDWFSIGPLTIHGYGVMTALGLIAALLLASFRAKKRGLSDDICYGILFTGVIFGYMGSKLMFVLVEFDEFIKNPRMIISSGGFVVVGGLTAGVIACYIYCRIKKVDFIEYFDLVAPSIALAQCLGRIGCFFAGCCYGRETTSACGITFLHSDFAPNGVKLIPTQLIMSGANLIHMAVLLLIARFAKKKGLVSGLYIIFYSIGRFLIEYLRNDDRGTVGALSTSQFYSIITLVAGVIYLAFNMLRKEKETQEEVNEAV